jgi:hypothetical protein
MFGRNRIYRKLRFCVNGTMMEHGVWTRRENRDADVAHISNGGATLS